MPGTADEFLMERYTAHTERKGRRRLFRVDHAPWAFAAADLELRDASLPASTGPWFAHARLEGAVWSPGFARVRMGRPEPYDPEGSDRTARRSRTP